MGKEDGEKRAHIIGWLDERITAARTDLRKFQEQVVFNPLSAMWPPHASAARLHVYSEVRSELASDTTTLESVRARVHNKMSKAAADELSRAAINTVCAQGAIITAWARLYQEIGWYTENTDEKEGL